jgi:hypothetical protein
MAGEGWTRGLRGAEHGANSKARKETHGGGEAIASRALLGSFIRIGTTPGRGRACRRRRPGAQQPQRLARRRTGRPQRRPACTNGGSAAAARRQFPRRGAGRDVR